MSLHQFSPENEIEEADEDAIPEECTNLGPASASSALKKYNSKILTNWFKDRMKDKKLSSVYQSHQNLLTSSLNYIPKTITMK